MNEMIERVARALCLRRGKIDGESDLGDYVERHWSCHTEEARDAIAAMREPTEAMVEAAGDAKNSDWDEIWHPMIDAALKE
jgi:hypothetical protein